MELVVRDVVVTHGTAKQPCRGSHAGASSIHDVALFWTPLAELYSWYEDGDLHP
jgi:hypothetical protein